MSDASDVVVKVPVGTIVAVPDTAADIVVGVTVVSDISDVVVNVADANVVVATRRRYYRRG